MSDLISSALILYIYNYQQSWARILYSQSPIDKRYENLHKKKTVNTLSYLNTQPFFIIFYSSHKKIITKLHVYYKRVSKLYSSLQRNQ